MDWLHDSERATGRAWLLFTIKDFSAHLSAALVIVLLLFLLRWHVLKRIERLRA
jgi:hypothetical protein